MADHIIGGHTWGYVPEKPNSKQIMGVADLFFAYAPLIDVEEITPRRIPLFIPEKEGFVPSMNRIGYAGIKRRAGNKIIIGCADIFYAVEGKDKKHTVGGEST